MKKLDLHTVLKINTKGFHSDIIKMSGLFFIYFIIIYIQFDFLSSDVHSAHFFRKQSAMTPRSYPSL